MEIRVYLDSSCSPVNPNKTFRVYDNGVRVGELIDDDWWCYERLFQKDQIEFRKIIQCEPELHYWNIESDSVEFTKVDGVIIAKGSGGSFIQWQVGQPVPRQMPAELLSRIESALEQFYRITGSEVATVLQKVPERSFQRRQQPQRRPQRQSQQRSQHQQRRSQQPSSHCLIQHD